jgi:hypothetical protein
MSTAAQLPQVRDMAPDFTLESVTGSKLRLSDFRGRRDLVLVFARQGKENQALVLLRALNRDELEAEETQVLVIVAGGLPPESPESTHFPVLLDRDGAVTDRYAATVVITDRYGEIYSVHRGISPTADEVMASLRHINAECPE